MVCRPEVGTPLNPGQNGRDIAQFTDAATESHGIATNSGQHSASGSEPLLHQETDDASVQAAIALIHGKWKIGILARLRHGPLRLSQLCRMIPGASKKMLTQHLREMEEDGVIVRSDHRARVRHVEYSLAPSLCPAVLHLIDTLAQLGRQHKPAISAEENATELSE